MKISKAIITAAARGGRLYPVGDTVQKAMLPLADVDGVHKPVIQIIAEEAFAAGVEEICLICAPGDEKRYVEAFTTLRNNLTNSYGGVDWAREQAEKITNLLDRLTFVVQKEMLGFGHAVMCGQKFVGDDAFLLLLGDHLYRSDLTARNCATQLTDLAKAEACSVSAVNPTPEHLIGHYGTVTGRYVAGLNSVYEVERIIEKPSISQAELELQTPGMRVGHYLCFFGMHVLEAAIFPALEKQMKKSKQDVQLTPALQRLANQRKYLAAEVKGRRFNLGTRFGLLEAQVAFALDGVYSEELLSTIISQLAVRNRTATI
ncbi:MAG: sugar phosphate nucleotidyltransferase [Bacteroidota bacterium]